MTIELTNERLEEIADEYMRVIYPQEVGQMARELLTLRSRDAGDENNLRFREHLEQVDDWIGKVPVTHLETVFERDARITLSKMEEMYITRGQQLREALEEVERLKVAIGCATTIKGDMVMRADDPLGMMQEVCSYVATLTAERDESEGKVHSARIFIDALSKYIDCGATLENSGNWYSYLQTVANNWNLRMQEACDLRDRYVAERNKAQNEVETLKSELAALRSAPSMAEVDEQFGGLSARLGFLPPSRTREECQSGIEKCYRITCRFAAERDEVVRLLKWLYRFTDAGKAQVEIKDIDKARRIIEIVEGK